VPEVLRGLADPPRADGTAAYAVPVTTGDDEIPAEVPHAKAPDRTLVMDAGSHRQLLWIDGVVILPVGARIELADPKADAVVIGIRLWGAGGGSHPLLVLDVMLVQPGARA